MQYHLQIKFKNSIDRLKFSFNTERICKLKVETKEITQAAAQRDKDVKNKVEILRQKYFDYPYMKIK